MLTSSAFSLLLSLVSRSFFSLFLTATLCSADPQPRRAHSSAPGALGEGAAQQPAGGDVSLLHRHLHRLFHQPLHGTGGARPPEGKPLADGDAQYQLAAVKSLSWLCYREHAIS